jgi:uncharacterized protein DUF6093
MSRASVLARSRAAAEAGMVDTCTITRAATTFTNPDTGQTTTSTTTVYTGACRVQQRVPGGARTTDVGEAHQLMLRMEVQLPMSVTGVKVGDTVTVTASVHDADLAGRRFRVRELAHKTEATARRLGVEEIT